MNRIQRGIKTAADAAKFATHSRYQVGAAIFVGNKLISIGWNEDKTDPKQRSIFRWRHAETAALVGTRKSDLTKATMYVVRVTKTGMLRIARPCPDCQRILRAAGIRRVVYTNRLGKPEHMRL